MFDISHLEVSINVNAFKQGYLKLDENIILQYCLNAEIFLELLNLLNHNQFFCNSNIPECF